MNLLSDIITYVRRIIKTPSNAVITDNLIIDYVNRFWLMDVDARVQLFDLKTTYQFQTIPGINQYNMPLYDVQIEPGNQTIASYPVYQGFMSPCYANGIQIPFYTEKNSFWNLWPSYVQSLVQTGTGDGTVGPYTLNLSFSPAIPGHIDMSGIIATGANVDPPFVNPGPSTNFLTTIPTTSVYSGVYFTATDENGSNIVVADSGQFLDGNTGGVLYGLLMAPGNAPFGNTALAGGYSTTSNTINYATGVATVTFPVGIPVGTPINAQSYFFEQGIPRAVLYYNNCITVNPPPNIPYLVTLTAYLTPAAFLNTSSAIQFAYMAEYIARGAARKILADTGDVEQFQFYEPLFKEQETLVWKRSQRIFTSTRTGTIFSELQGQSPGNNIGNGTA